MRDIWIFQHTAGEGPGYFAEFLASHGLAHRLIQINRNDPVPDSIEDAAGLVFMGGPMSVNDPLPWIGKEVALIRQAVDAGVPVLGHCLGGQLMSKALGGRVKSNHAKEIGWLPVDAVESPATRTWLDGLPSRFEVFHWHGESFSIPPGGTHILSSRHCRNQGFALGNSLALQCHIEMTPSMVRTWAQRGTREIAKAGLSESVQGPAQMRMALPRRIEHLRKVADVIYTRWIAGLKR